MTAEASPRPWRVEDDQIVDANGLAVTPIDGGARVSDADMSLIADAVNLKARIDEAMADESGYLHLVALDGKPAVFVTPPPSEAEESRMHREYETSLLVDRERFRRGYYEAAERNDRLRDIVRRFADLSESLIANYEYHYCADPNSMAFVQNVRDFVRDARAAIGGEKQ